MKRNVIRLTLIISGSILFLLFAPPLFSFILNAGNLAGLTGASVLLLSGIFYNFIEEKVRRILKNKKGRLALTSLTSIVCVLGLCFCIALGSVVGASTTNADTQQTVIVLGCAVKKTVPSRMLRQRINAAYEFLEAHPDSVAVLSGGQGNGESISEAQCMFNVLTEMGIDESRLYLEDKSTSTYENIKFSKEIIEKNNLPDTIALASSDYHLRRAVMIAEKQSIDAATISAQTEKLFAPTYFVRDTFGAIKEYLVK